MIDIQAALVEAEKAEADAKLRWHGLAAKSDDAHSAFCDATCRVQRLKDLQKAMNQAALHGDL